MFSHYVLNRTNELNVKLNRISFRSIHINKASLSESVCELVRSVNHITLYTVPFDPPALFAVAAQGYSFYGISLLLRRHDFRPDTINCQFA